MAFKTFCNHIFNILENKYNILTKCINKTILILKTNGYSLEVKPHLF